MTDDRNGPIAPEHDEFDRLLRAALRSGDSGTGSECLDAGVLAAWCDGALSPSERSFADAHLARCARCQSLLAVMARTAPAAAAASAAWSLRRWTMMLAPAAAATTAVALWFAIEPATTRRESPVQQVASHASQESAPASPAPAGAVTAPKDAVSAAPVAAPSAEESRREDDAKRRSNPQAAPAPFGSLASDAVRERQMASAREAVEEEKRRLPDAEAAKSAASVTVTASSPTIQVSSAQVNTTANANAAPREPNTNAPGNVAGFTGNIAQAKPVGDRRNEAPPPPPPAATVAPVPSRADAPQAPPLPSQTRQQTQQGQQQAAGAGAGRGGAGAAVGGVVAKDQDPFRATFSSAEAVRFVVASPDASVQWRVVADGIVQHSTDRGATWATQYTLGPKEALAAGSAPAPGVAWLVGRAGLVLTTSDGRTWARVSFPVAVDLTTVAAVDARTAIVTASDGRVFRTSDAGRTWAAR
jgi:photosynthesis system II assembly factor YCF48-like protein/putative zinc finger protein